MNNCATCSHFAPGNVPPRLGDGWGDCNLITDAEEPGQLAVTWDYEGYASGLYVSPEFGCVQWKERAT